MSSVQAHIHREGDPRHGARTGAPIALADIDRALRDSAGVADAGPDAPIRAWRDELADAREAIVYAGTVLSADIGILRARLAGALDGEGPALDELPQAMSSRSWGSGWSAPVGSAGPAAVDWGIFARSDTLISLHSEMARVDLSARHDVARVVGDMERQLTELARRQDAVEQRLRDIRAAIVRQYRDGVVAAENRPR